MGEICSYGTGGGCQGHNPCRQSRAVKTSKHKAIGYLIKVKPIRFLAVG
jgi:hypothetical protein